MQSLDVSEQELHDWIVVGGGIAGLSIGEILARAGKSVLLLEKNSTLASETTKVFHEWLHTGALFTLVPDRLLTLRYLLGAIDDLLEYYQSFPGMNLVPSERGFTVAGTGWFNPENIVYKYRIRRFNPVWLSLVSRSARIVEKVASHDWLRRRAGAEYGYSRLSRRNWLSLIPRQIRSRGDFLRVVSPDVTINSRVLLADLLRQALASTLQYCLNTDVTRLAPDNRGVTVYAGKREFHARQVVVCAPDAVAAQFGMKTTVGYAPIAVVADVPEDAESFVELDYFVKNCINLLRKPNRLAQAGGITLNNQAEVPDYLAYVIRQHQRRMPGIRVLGTYTGLKKELVNPGENRNYLYHIMQHDPRLWSVVLGKFSLAFSMAPEFYRRVYHCNPAKTFSQRCAPLEPADISATAWEEVAAGARGA